MILGYGEIDFKDSDGGGLDGHPFSIGGTDFDNRTAFRLALAVLFISGSNCKSSLLGLPRINSKIP